MAGESADPTADQLRLWKIQLLKYRKAAGHPNNYNLARIIKESGKAKWQVEAALRLECDDCKALKLGGSSSGQIPPAAVKSPPAAWEAVGKDTTDWTPPNSKRKCKLLVMMDLATKSSKVSSAPPGAEPESKRQRADGELGLSYSCFMEVEMCYMLTVDLEIASQRQKQAFVFKPSLFVAQKLRDFEVRLVKLRPEHRVLFDRATKEVNSFISNAAVHPCHNLEEEAKSSGRLMRCRWVLTWKLTPEEGLAEAKAEVLNC